MGLPANMGLLSPAEEFIQRWETGDITETSFGVELRDLRRRLRIRIKELAKFSELTVATLSNIENSKRPPRIDTVVKLFAGLRSIQKSRRAES